MRSIDSELSRQWSSLLEEELRVQQEQLELANAITRALVERRESDFTRLVQQQDRQAQTSRDLTTRREALCKRTATALDCGVDAVRLPLLLDAVPVAERERLTDLRDGLREVAEANHRVADRNALLIRTSLGIVRECIDVVAGPRLGDGYQRNGVQVTRQSQCGGLLNVAG